MLEDVTIYSHSSCANKKDGNNSKNNKCFIILVFTKIKKNTKISAYNIFKRQ